MAHRLKLGLTVASVLTIACLPQEFEPPSGKIKEAIDHEFGSLDDFIAKFNPTTAAVQASHLCLRHLQESLHLTH